MSLRLLDTGLQSLVVDAGRPQSRALGVPVGGAADGASLAIGNALVGNPPGSAAIEFALTGPKVRAETSTACVVFGVPFAVAIDGHPLEAGMTFTLKTGEVLAIGGTATGARGYLCVAGGFETAEILGSRSALEPLKAGDVLACAASRCEPRGLGFSRLPSRCGPDGSLVLRVIDGPQSDWFESDCFFAQVYEVTATSNRMGLRLRGEPVTRCPGELVSEAVAPGAVQITNDGLPVVLGVDGQTIGGYPKIAHVIRADLDSLGQLRSGDRVRFSRVPVEEAEEAASIRSAIVASWLARLRAADRRPVFD